MHFGYHFGILSAKLNFVHNLRWKSQRFLQPALNLSSNKFFQIFRVIERFFQIFLIKLFFLFFPFCFVSFSLETPNHIKRCTFMFSTIWIFFACRISKLIVFLRNSYSFSKNIMIFPKITGFRKSWEFKKRGNNSRILERVKNGWKCPKLFSLRLKSSKI